MAGACRLRVGRALRGGVALMSSKSLRRAGESDATQRAGRVVLSSVSFRYHDETADSDETTRAAVSGGSVEGIDLAIDAGACTVLCGRTGSGKSTVLRLIEGLAGTFFSGDRTGEVALCGDEVSCLTSRQRTERLGVVMQDPRSQFFMSVVGDEIAFSLESLGKDPEVTASHVREAASLCGVGELLCERISGLSSGQRQRVALASAVAHRPQVLVLDEPLANLDDEGSESLVRIVSALKLRGVAVVVSEHRLAQLEPVADEFVYLDGGRIAARWSTQEFSRLTSDDKARYGLRHSVEGTCGASSGGCRVRAPGARDACVSGIEPAGVSFAGGPDASSWRLADVTYRYPSSKRGIHALSAEFPVGAVTVVRGQNGAGKTTLAKVLVGAIREQKGTVFRGEKRLSRRARRRCSYFVMQDADYQLYAASVAEEIVLGRRMSEPLRLRAKEALEAFGLEEVACRHPASLSGGQKQRVTLAAAYCSDAELVVLDEPTSGLDGDGLYDVAQWCRKIADEGKAVVVITHDDLLARLVGDQVVDLDVKCTCEKGMK